MQDFQSAENLMRLKELKISGAMLRAYRNGEKYRNDVSLSDAIWRSPSRVAERVAAFRAYFTMADLAMDKLVRLRDQFAKKLNAANDFLKTQDDNETLTNLLLDGDDNEIEYGVLTEKKKNSIIASSTFENVTKKLQQARVQKICDETEVNENVAQAYVKIRQLMTKAYHALNDAKRRPKINSKYLDVSESVLERFKKDSAMQVMKATVKGIADGEKIYIAPKISNFSELGMDEKKYASIMGDKDFDVFQFSHHRNFYVVEKITFDFKINFVMVNFLYGVFFNQSPRNI